MRLEQVNICCGCLSTDRKMLLIEDASKRLCFLDIISALSISETVDQTLYLCWECKALIDRFIKFKQQVKLSYCIFQDYIEEKISIAKVQSHTKLSKHTVDIVEINPNVSSEVNNHVSVDIVKVENDNSMQLDVQVKEENYNTYSDHNNSDDQVLVDVKRDAVSKIRKKRRKKELRIYKELELSRDEIEEERRLMALKEEYVNAMFRCERCIETFANEDDMLDHVTNKHNMNKSNLKCKICQCTFSTDISFSYHRNKHIRRYQCIRCDTRFLTKRGATKHYGIVHCADYDLPGKQEQNGRLEAGEDSDSTKQQLESYPCEFCEKTFRWKTSLRKHMETHRIQSGQKRKPYCEPCRLSFTTSANLRKHVKTSSKHQIQLKLRKLKESRPEEASNPEKVEASIEQIKCSVNKAREQFACQQCDKRFQWRGNLLRHLDSHQARANGELVCEPCKRSFSSIATYKQHLKISKKHVSENDFKYMCSDCGKKFANKTRLKDHIDWEHLKNYVHTCPVCQKVFKSHTSLYLHKQVVHKNGQTEHLCDHCGKPFPNRAKLRSHVRALHSPESAYKCHSCSARFSWHSCLSRHVRRVHGPTREAPAREPVHV